MVLTKSELVDSLQQEVSILVHLAGKIERSMLDYRPTPKQRSTLELLRYLSMMGPQLVRAAKAGGFDPKVWTEAEQATQSMNFDQVVAAIKAQADDYTSSLGSMSDGDFRAEIDMFGSKTSRGKFIVTYVLGGHAAYRTQLFCYLKACGRHELSTMNLWGGMDAPVAAV